MRWRDLEPTRPTRRAVQPRQTSRSAGATLTKFMSMHRAPAGKGLIRAIVNFGRALGYHVVTEHPLPSNGAREAPAVDVAWFGSRKDPFPLMLFEVESTASNTMANNALKVFAPKTEAFEKPLFLFHVVASGGSESTRLDNLRQAYGSHNYRIYAIGAGAVTDLARDVISQHRRIRRSLQYTALFHALKSPDWPREIDTLAVLQHARSTGLSRSTYLGCTLDLARAHPELADEVVRVFNEGEFVHHQFRTYLGNRCAEPILAAFALGRASSDDEVRRQNDRLLRWQDDGVQKQIEPSFGIDRGYDDFLLNVAAPFVALAVGSAARRGSALRELCRALSRVLARLRPAREGINLAVWLCHIAVALGDGHSFDIATQYIAALGGVPEAYLYNPAPLADDQEFPETLTASPCVIPARMTSFSDAARLHHPAANGRREDNAFRALIDDNFVTEWSKPVLQWLWSTTER